MREIKITMPLIPNLSVNHYLIKAKHGFFKRKDVVAWQEALGWQIKTSHIEDWKLPLTVRCDLVQSDNRTRDISNFSKAVLDAIEETTGINDNLFRWMDGDITKGTEAQLIITIREWRG